MDNSLSMFQQSTARSFAGCSSVQMKSLTVHQSVQRLPVQQLRCHKLLRVVKMLPTSIPIESNVSLSLWSLHFSQGSTNVDLEAKSPWLAAAWGHHLPCPVSESNSAIRSYSIKLIEKFLLLRYFQGDTRPLALIHWVEAIRSIRILAIYPVQHHSWCW
jgi:hypothetical protein